MGERPFLQAWRLTGVAPLDQGRGMQPQGLVMVRGSQAVYLHCPRAEKLTRFELIDAQAHGPVRSLR